MNSNSQSNGLSQVSEFQQCPDSGLHVQGVDELRQPLTQGGGSPHSQFSAKSNVNTSFGYQLTREPPTRTWPLGCTAWQASPLSAH